MKKLSILLILFFLVSCSYPSPYLRKQAKSVRGKTYVSASPLFVVRMFDTGELVLWAPGTGSHVPLSLEAYLAHPTTWFWTKEHQEQYKGCTPPPTEWIIGYVPGETILKVKRSRAVASFSFQGVRVTMESTMDSGQKVSAEGRSLFNSSFKEGEMYPDPRYIKPYDPSSP